MVRPTLAVGLSACLVAGGLLAFEQASGARPFAGLFASSSRRTVGFGGATPSANLPSGPSRDINALLQQLMSHGGQVGLPDLGGVLPLPSAGGSGGVTPLPGPDLSSILGRLHLPGGGSIGGSIGGSNGGSNGTQILAMARGIADRGVGQVRQAAAASSGTAADGSPICGILLSVRASIVNQIEALAARFPFIAGPLRAIEAQAVATINAIGSRFDCRLPSR